MATRHLQRLRELEETQDASKEETESEGSNEVEEPRQPKFNPFALLSDDEDEDIDQGDEDDEDAAASPPEPQPAPMPVAPAKASKKPKRKRNKAAKGAALDDVDSALKELNLQPGRGSDQQHASTSAQPASARGDVLAIVPKCLKAEEELKAMFGKDVLALERQAERAGGSAARRGAAARRGGGVPRALLLVPSSSLDTVAARPYDGSLIMESRGPTSDGGTEFEYTASGIYRTASAHFEQAQSTHDPNAVVAVLQRYPFHVDSLLAMHDLYQATGSNDYAGSVLDTAIYALESAWHVHFKAKLLAAQARLPPSAGCNAVFYRACLRYIRALAKRGCHRTALEWCKMVLAVDREDPCGLLFWIDYLALRSGQYDFLKAFMDTFASSTPLHLLPNYLFNAALTQYYTFKGSRQDTPAVNATGVHEASENPDLDQQLVNAILTFPSAFIALHDELQDKGAAKSAAWSSLRERSLFTAPHCAGSASLSHISRIFAVRNVEMWKAPDVAVWLLRCAEAAAESAAASTAPESAAATAQPRDDEASNALTAEDAAMLAQSAWPDSDENEFAHCVLANYVDSVAALPPEQLMGGAGPMEGGVGGAPGGPGNDRRVHITADELRNGNPAMMLLRTLLPWVTVDGGGQDANEGDRGGGGGQDEAVPARALMQSLRDMGLVPELERELRERGIDPTDWENLSAEELEVVGEVIANLLQRGLAEP